MSSTTHLIDSLSNDGTTNQEQYGERTNAVNKTTYRTVSKHLKLQTFIFSIISFGCLCAAFILTKKQSYWMAQQSTKELAKWVFASLIISVAGLAISLPSIMNLVINITFSYGIISTLVRFFQWFPPTSWCSRWRYPQYPGEPTQLPPDAECLEKMKEAKTMMMISGVFASLLAAIYVARALLRGIPILRSRFWTQSTWSIPSGNYTFHVSLNVVRPQEDTEAADSRGPVHL